MLEFFSSLFNTLIGLPGVVWEVTLGIFAGVMVLAYFVYLGVSYGILSLSRTLGIGACAVLALFGALSYFMYWTVDYFLSLDNIQHHEVFILAPLKLFFLALPPAIFIFRTPAGKGLNLMDGLILGAFTGIGYYLVYHLHQVMATQSWLSWPPGSFTTTVDSLLPNTLYFFTGFPAVGAMLGCLMVLTQFLRHRALWWPLPLLLVIPLMIYEDFSFQMGVLHRDLIGEAGGFWFNAISFLNIIDFSGRLSATLFLVILIVAFVMGERSLKRFLEKESWLKLDAETGAPGLLGELLTTATTLRFGFSSVMEVWGFFGSRRRVAAMEDRSRGTRLAEDGQYLEYLDLAQEIASDRMFRAKAALRGDPVQVQDDEGGNRVKAFFKGLVLAMVGAWFYLSLISQLGLMISTALGRRLGNGGDPMGFVYATIIVTGMTFAFLYYRTTLTKMLGAWAKSFMKGRQEKAARRPLPPPDPRVAKDATREIPKDTPKETVHEAPQKESESSPETESPEGSDSPHSEISDDVLTEEHKQ